MHPVLFLENPGFFQGRVNEVQISLYLFTTAMVDEFSSHDAPNISLSIFGWDKITLYIMHTSACIPVNQHALMWPGLFADAKSEPQHLEHHSGNSGPCNARSCPD